MGEINTANFPAHIIAFLDVFKARLEDIDTVPANWFLLSTVPADSLYYLAEQFGVLGYKGWILADTDDKRRQLIRDAVEIQRTIGTPYSIRKSLELAGFANVEIIEAVDHNAIPFLYNGVYQYNGVRNYGATWTWAMFGVWILPDVGNPAITGEIMELLRKLINAMKPARCKLVEFGIREPQADAVAVDDTNVTVTII